MESVQYTWQQAQQHHRCVVNSPHSGQSRCCPAATAGIPRISPGPCWAAGGVTHHLLPEDTAAECQNGKPTPEPTWGRSGSRVVAARPHSDWAGRRRRRRTGPVWNQRSTRLNSATSCRQTHVENNTLTHGCPRLLFTSCPTLPPLLWVSFWRYFSHRYLVACFFRQPHWQQEASAYSLTTIWSHFQESVEVSLLTSSVVATASAQAGFSGRFSVSVRLPSDDNILLDVP